MSAQSAPERLESAPERPGGFDASRALFVGLGDSAVCWYRCALPAMTLGADWMGVLGQPGQFAYRTGYVKGGTQLPRYEDYEVIVLQQPRGRRWLRFIRDLQRLGIKVVYEVDDYVHGIRKMQDHDFRLAFDRDSLADMELCMRVCDAMICSTEFIARRYRKFNRRVFVCENGVDLARYKLTRPPRPTVNIGWAGATGHARAMLPWLDVVPRVMERHDNTCFVTIGQNFADELARRFTPARALSIPFTMVDSYPSAMTLFDVALAPAGKGNFFRGKSDLRWLEASALGIPVIADPDVYSRIEHGVTGFHAGTPAEAEELLELLVVDPKLRTEVGENARRLVVETRSMSVTSRRWLAAFGDITSG